MWQWLFGIVCMISVAMGKVGKCERVLRLCSVTVGRKIASLTQRLKMNYIIFIIYLCCCATSALCFGFWGKTMFNILCLN